MALKDLKIEQENYGNLTLERTERDTILLWCRGEVVIIENKTLPLLIAELEEENMRRNG